MLSIMIILIVLIIICNIELRADNNNHTINTKYIENMKTNMISIIVEYLNEFDCVQRHGESGTKRECLSMIVIHLAHFYIITIIIIIFLLFAAVKCSLLNVCVHMCEEKFHRIDEIIK